MEKTNWSTSSASWSKIDRKEIRLRARWVCKTVQRSGGFEKSTSFYFHRIDLRPTIEVLFRSFHKDCVQRKIRRAEREGLVYEEGRSEALLAKFYQLLVLTCRRKQLPPQPLAWFRHLISCMGDSLTIHVCSKDDRLIASVLTLSFKGSLVYKYGCSDPRLRNLGGTHLLLWRAIHEAKRSGRHEFDLGRSDLDTPGLVTFKDRWGATRFLTKANSPLLRRRRGC